MSFANFCEDGLRNGVFGVYIVLRDDVQEGSYTLDSFHYGGIELAGGDYYYDTVETSLFHTGELKVDKFDEERISGRFEFKAYHKQRDSVYSIANGKFTDVSVSGSN